MNKDKLHVTIDQDGESWIDHAELTRLIDQRIDARAGRRGAGEDKDPAVWEGEIEITYEHIIWFLVFVGFLVLILRGSVV
jgi:hypothetical protein